MRRIALAVVGLGLVMAAGCSPTMLSAEPRPGSLSAGQSVLVNDGTCPSGQVKKVTAGNRSVGLSRKTECVAAPPR